MAHPTSWFRLSRPLMVAVLGMCCLTAVGQQQPAAPVERERPSDAIRSEAQRPGLGQLHRDFGFPGSIRSWERGMYLNPRHRAYGYSYPSVYGPYSDYYARPYAPYYARHGTRDRENRLYRESYDGSSYQNYALRLDDAYELGVAPAEVQERIAVQAERSLTEYSDVMEAGHEAFSRGQYNQAARYFLLASQLNHGDPGSRLCAAHAQTALGQYQSAAKLVHRAFDLQPKLAFISLDIEGSYGRPDFSQHLRALREAAEGSRDCDLWFLLGYYEYNSGHFDLGSTALERAHRLRPHDRVIRRFADAVGGVTP